jgi:hypothetical protein
MKNGMEHPAFYTFSQLETSISRGFPLLCLMTPDGKRIQFFGSVVLSQGPERFCSFHILHAAFLQFQVYLEKQRTGVGQNVCTLVKMTLRGFRS